MISTLSQSADTPRKWLLQTLPRLEEGLNLVDFPGKLPVFQILLGNELQFGEKALWIDCADHASTYEMARYGGDEILRQIKVSRNYTPFQHYSAVQKAENELSNEFSILVLPEINLLYEDGQLREKEAEDLFEETVERIRSYSEEYGLKVICSIRGCSEFSYLLEDIISQRIEVEKTDFGLKFGSQSFESQVFQDGSGLQTTVPLYAENRVVRSVSEVNQDGEDEQDLSPAFGTIPQ